MSQRTATYTFGNVLDTALRKFSRAVENETQATIAQLSLNEIWMKYDWRESKAILPNFYLIPNEQDHGAPAVTIPSDFFGLRDARLLRATTIPPMRQPLAIIKDLQLTHIRYIPHAINFVPAKKAFRLYPRVPENIGSPDYMVEGEYKIKPQKITSPKLASTLLPFDDVYFQVWVEMAKYWAMRLDDDPRAGAISVAPGGQITYTGQAAMAYSALAEMASNEGLELGDPVISPSEPLATGGVWRPNIFGIGFGF